MSIGFPACVLAAAAGSGLEAGREVVSTDDGWAGVANAALPLGTTGRSNGAARRTLTVTNRAELVAALRYPDPTPKLVYIRGSIDVNVDDNGMPLSCKDYHRPDPFTGELFNIHAFTASFDPAGTWGKRAPFGGQENARVASAAAQEKRVRIRIPANTTIYGLGQDAAIVGAWLDIAPESASGSQPMNIIIRNISFEDTTDCFPEWSPDDGPTGNWNSRYDSISIRNATHVWIDHNRFADARTRDATQPSYFGRLYQVHDGFVDITDESDFVTVSWNHFKTHDKTMLIGESDGAVADRNKLHVTIHHNLFENLGQRAPRVRFGQVHVYNNLYKVNRDTNYHSTWGAGFESQIYAENNYLEFSAMYGPMEVIDGRKGTQITTVGNCWKEGDQCLPTDFVAEWNANFDPDLKTDVGWKPKLYGPASAAEPPESARERVLKESGPGRAGTK